MQTQKNILREYLDGKVRALESKPDLEFVRPNTILSKLERTWGYLKIYIPSLYHICKEQGIKQAVRYNGVARVWRKKNKNNMIAT